MPFVLCSTRNGEHLVQVLNNNGITEIMKKWLVPERKGHNFGHFLASEYKDDWKYIDNFFRGDFEKIYPPEIIKARVSAK